MSGEIDYPQFAVVGHPNKGKSSIVASLADDNSVQISDTPGTTSSSRSFPLVVDGVTIYELFDTPGFQRARRVLAYLQAHDVAAHQRHEVVSSFIQKYADDPKYNDEIELLTPIMQGAGIIYVVDASKPYGAEYEAEMEILRWSGQPSMALINHIGDEDYTAEWRRALEQYFRIVRTYDPMRVDQAQKIDLLEAMAQLKQEWSRPLKQAINLFESINATKLRKSAKNIAQLLQTSLSFIDKTKISADKADDKEQEKAIDSYQDKIRKLEAGSQKSIEQIYNHVGIQKSQEQLLLDGIDLFSKESISIFGLSKDEILITGVTGGAIAGAGIDLLFAGHTLLVGGAIGAVAGGVSAYLGFDKISDTKILGQKLGDRYIVLGPMKNINFPYILLGRAIYHLCIISRQSHANRKPIEIRMDESFKQKWLDKDMRKSLEKIHKRFRSGKEIDIKELEQYTVLVLECIRKVI